VSIEAIHWSLNSAPIPRDRRDASSLASVLIGLANHADPDGRNAFPSVARLTRYTRLSESTVRRALDSLEELDLITPSDPVIVAAHIPRADRRPQGWDLAVHRSYPQVANGVPPRHPVQDDEVSTRPDGVSVRAQRGAVVTPEPSLNRPGNRHARERVSKARSPLPPPCGQCDARPADPVSARMVWLDMERTEAQRCPRCHPGALLSTGGVR
jgi:hypothetical protein